MTTRSGRVLRAVVLLLGLGVAAPALLACGDDKPKKVRVSVVVILASETDTAVEKKLQCIAEEVRKTHPKLKGFKSVNLICKSLPVGLPDTFNLVEDKQVDINVVRAANKDDRVCLKVGPPKMRQITYSTPCGKFLPILTPLQTKAGEHVLIAIRVQPCNGK
jgi:hypothetical protein